MRKSGNSVETAPVFVLVHGAMRTGGTETLILRVANHLAENGSNVILLCAEGPLIPLISCRVQKVFFSSARDLLQLLRSGAMKLDASSSVFVLSFGPISAALGLIVELNLHVGGRVRHASAVLHPRWYFMTGERWDRIKLLHLVARAIGYRFLFFMNRECRIEHSRRWAADLSVSPIIALPVDDAGPLWQPSKREVVRIVSIGRLVDFKAYNLAAPKLVKECQQRGINVSWDIFGYGPLAERIQQEADSYGVGNIVMLKGALPYSKFVSTVLEYDLFIGMGTAAVEAAMLGVPTICATVDHGWFCYGYLPALPRGNVGECRDEPPRVEIVGLLESYAYFDTATRNDLSRQCRTAAKEYSTPQFVGSLLDLYRSEYRPPSRLLKGFVMFLFFMITDSRFTKTVRLVRDRAAQRRQRKCAGVR